ncbi:MAG TPA: hypothetical protein VFX60_08340 [Micromonospora sp.]|nr:hypothetical protein [Micromonospora sp.]
MRSQRSFLRGIALLAVTSVLLASCTTKAPQQSGNALDQPFETTGIDTERIGEPVPVKAGDSKAAATLAEQVMKGGPEGIAALATAVNLAGITITDINGQVFREPTNPSIGQSLQAGQVGLLASLQARGESHLRVGGMLAFVIEALDPEIKPDKKEVMSDLLTGLRDDTTSKFATDKFIASFIIELEKRGNTPVDLGKKVADPMTVQLSPVSTTLLMLRVIGEIRAALPKDAVLELPDTGGQGGGTGQPVIRPVGYSAGAAASIRTARAANKIDCSSPMPAADDFIYDRLSELGDSDKFRYKFNAVSFAAKKAGLSEFGKKMLGAVVGALLEFLKLILAGEFFKPTMEMKPNKLERTRSASQDGANAVVYATIRFDTGGWEYANCARTLLALAGLDFSFKQNGPVKNAPVSWEPKDGFTATSNGLPLVKLDKVAPIGVSAEETNEKGETAVTIIGHRQPKQVPETAKKVEKSFTLNGTYHSKSEDYWENLVTGLGLFVGVLVGGPAGAAAAAIKVLAMALEEGGLYKFGRSFPLIDYGGDYKINHTAGGLTFTGLVCNSPVGKWEIKITGKIGDSSTNWTYTGGITVILNQDGIGQASGTLNGESSGIFGFGSLKKSAPFDGDAKLHDAGTTNWLELKLGAGAAELTGPKGPLFTGHGPPGTFTIPVDVGNFCGAS